LLYRHFRWKWLFAADDLFSDLEARDPVTKTFGQCFCGAIRYEAMAPLKFVVHDHCSMCRRVSGAAFVTWAGVVESQFKLLQGGEKIQTFRSSAEAIRSFCRDCGTHLFFRSTRWPGEVHFTFATVTSKVERPPQAHIYFSDKVDWLDISDGVPKRGGHSGMDPL